MTNKEAIEILNRIAPMPRRGDGKSITQSLVMEAIVRAIQALEQTSYKSEARRWKRRYLDLKQRIFKMEERTSWIPCSEKMPEELVPVNITWVNHEPEPYYHDIKDRNFVATGIYYRGQWYWYSTTCADYLGEYGSNEIDKVDDAVEIIAWMPLPSSYQGEENG